MQPAQIESYAAWLERAVAGFRGRVAQHFRAAAAQLRQSVNNPWEIS